MDRFFKHVLRIRDQRRTAVDQKRRVKSLVANSNCIGTTNNLFCDKWTRTFATDLKATKKARRQSDFQSNSLLKNSSRRLYHKWSALVQK